MITTRVSNGELTTSLALKILFAYVIFAYLIRTYYLFNYSDVPQTWAANGVISLNPAELVMASSLLLFGTACTVSGIMVLSRIKLFGQTNRTGLLSKVDMFRKPSLLTLCYAAMIGLNFFMYSRLIGITGYNEFEPLPFRLVGIIFYSRQFLFPLVLVLIAATSRGSIIPAALIISESFLGSVFSGSRHVSLLHTAPLLFTKIGPRLKNILFISVLAINFFAATSARELNKLYIGGNSASAKGAVDLIVGVLDPDALFSVAEGFYKYIFYRASGFFEFLVVSSNTSKLLGDYHSYFLRSLTHFNDIDLSQQVDIKYLYGVRDGNAGGYGLDLFGNILYSAAGNVALYLFYCFFTGGILGLSKQLAVGLNRAYLNVPGLDVFIYIAFFLMVVQFELFAPFYAIVLAGLVHVPVAFRFTKHRALRGAET